QVEETARISKVRKTYARLKTVAREREIEQSQANQ
ncbi:50S ribosomal protein L29, partial [Staphylococcus aureus]